MSGIPEATPIELTSEERGELEGLARSTKAEHRTRQRARIVLLATEGVATRAIGRAAGCTTGTASVAGALRRAARDGQRYLEGVGRRTAGSISAIPPCERGQRLWVRRRSG
jgi:hypothetical protein